MQHHFHMIQQFFEQLCCHHCNTHFDAEGVELLREEDEMVIINVTCTACHRQAGVAMVTMETMPEGRKLRIQPKRKLKDPELTPEEVKRLSAYSPINDNDVLDAHHFFQGLGDDWCSQVSKITGNVTVELPPDEPEAEPSESAL